LQTTRFFLSKKGISLWSILAILCLLTLTSCESKESVIGSPYFVDTIGFKTTEDTGFIQHSQIVKTQVQVAGKTYLINKFSGSLFAGRVNDPTASERMSVYTVVKFAPLQNLPVDSISRVTSATLTLHVVPYLYGDASNQTIDLALYTRVNGSSSDSNAPAVSDLSPIPVSTLTTTLSKDSSQDITFNIDASIVKSFNNEFVIAPGPAMSNVRAFVASDAGSEDQMPRLTYHLKFDNDSVNVVRKPTLDAHYVLDSSTVLPEEITLRGSLAQRLRFKIDEAGVSLRDTISPFSTINNALLVLKVDPSRTRSSAGVNDTLGPVVVQLFNNEASDDSTALLAFGTRDPNDPTRYTFQIRRMMENWLRHPEKNFGFELRSGYSTAYFEGVAVGVEDYTLGRWTFYGTDTPNKEDRPKLILTYSILK